MLWGSLPGPKVCLLPLVLAAGAATAGAQTRVLGPPRPVTIEFRVLGEGGAPIRDLTPADVVLKVDGKVRALRSLEVVQLDAPTAGGTPVTGLREPFATNDLPPERRDILLVLEDDSIAPGTEKPVRAAVDVLLRALSPHDRVGLLNIPRGGTNIGLTTNRDDIRAGVASLVGLSTRGQTTNDARCRTVITLPALKDLLLAVRGNPATTIAFFSSGIAPADTSAAVLGRSSDLCFVKLDYFDDVRDAAALSGVNFYAVHVYDDTAIAAPSASSDLVAGLESLAGAANGDTIRLTTQDGLSFGRLARETSAYYRATFDPEPGERDDKLHRIDVSVSRRGASVRAGSTVPIDRALEAGRSASTASVTDLLRTPDVHRDLRLRTAAYPSRGDSSASVKIVVVLESPGSDGPLKAAAVALYDARGRLTSQVTLRPEELALTPPFTAISAKPGAYRMRVAAIDASGRMGTVDGEIDARLARADPLTMSAMVFGTTAGGSFSPRLQFSDEASFVAYFELYGVPKATEVSVRFELAAVKDGPALGIVDGRLQLGASEGTWQVSGGIGLGQVPAGDYELRAVVSLDGKTAGRVTRTLRKVK